MFDKNGIALIAFDGLREPLTFGQVEQLLADKQLFIKLFAWSINGYTRRNDSKILFQATSQGDAVQLDLTTGPSDWRKRIPHTVEVIRQVLLKIYRDKSNCTLCVIRDLIATRTYLTYNGATITNQHIDSTQHSSPLLAECLIIFANVILGRLLRSLCNDDLMIRTDEAKGLDEYYEFTWTWRTSLLKPLTEHLHVHQRFEIAQRQGIRPDFTIIVGEIDDSEALVRFPCHRIMLNTWGGDGFRALLRIGMVEGASQSVHLKDINPSTAQFFLDGLYLGPEQLIKSDSRAEEVDLFDLINFACSYQITWLQDFCLNELKQHADVLTITEIRELLERFPAWDGLGRLFRGRPGKKIQVIQDPTKLPSNQLDQVAEVLLTPS